MCCIWPYAQLKFSPCASRTPNCADNASRLRTSAAEFKDNLKVDLKQS